MAVSYTHLIHNAFFENPITYTDFGDLLIKLNWMCDELQFPAAAMQLRSWSFTKKRQLGSVTVQKRNEAVMRSQQFVWPVGGDEQGETRQTAEDMPVNFCVQVLYRQNATLQGKIALQSTIHQESNFRSGLELISLMDGAIR